MEAGVKQGLNILKVELQEFLALFGSQRFRFGIISSFPRVALPPEEWEFVSRYVVPMRIGESVHPGRAGIVKPEPLAFDKECLIWRGDTVVVAEYVKWALRASAFLRGHPSAFGRFSGDDNHFGALKAILSLARETEALTSHVTEKTILLCEWLSERDLGKLPSLTKFTGKKPRFEILETKTHGASLSMAVLEFLLGDSTEDTYAIQELVRRFSEEFGLPKPLSEAQALFLHLLRKEGEKAQTFRKIAAGHPLLAGVNLTRFLNKLPEVIRNHIGRERGKGCWWKAHASK